MCVEDLAELFQEFRGNVLLMEDGHPRKDIVKLTVQSNELCQPRRSSWLRDKFYPNKKEPDSRNMSVEFWDPTLHLW